MQFTHRGREVNTAHMRAFATGHPFTPQIFLDGEGECFVAQHRTGWPEPKVRYVPHHEARRLAELYKVEDLKAALVEKPAKSLGFHDAATGKHYDTREMRRIEVEGQNGVIYVAADRRVFTEEGGELKELSKEEAGKLAEIFGRQDLREAMEGG